jgi:ABC-2 type transport system ATP-binding protein
VGLEASAHRRVKGYSMGMRQRLAIGAALLGDPDVLILDEPANGLDPPGIRWMRDLLRAEAIRGAAVLVSSHLLSEVAQVVDDVVVISQGRLRASGPLDSVLGGGDAVTRVRAAEPDRLRQVLSSQGFSVRPEASGALLVDAAAPEAVGALANEKRIALTELVAVRRSLEDAFLALTGGGA